LPEQVVFDFLSAVEWTFHNSVVFVFGVVCLEFGEVYSGRLVIVYVRIHGWVQIRVAFWFVVGIVVRYFFESFVYSEWHSAVLPDLTW
jgi:hypothetical protein